MAEFRIEQANWVTNSALMLDIRKTVFVAEQGVPLDLEIDNKDASATHLLAIVSDGAAVATGRLLTNGQVGRMAVLANWRYHGIGRAMLDRMLEIAASRCLTRVFLHAQCAALGFYEKAGFAPDGEVFLDAGIPHQAMYLKLDS